MGKYPLTPAEKARFDRIWESMATSKKTVALIDFDHFCSWLRGEDSSFYYAIKGKLKDLWEEVKTAVGDFAEGFMKGTCAVVGTPIVGLVEGISEGLENGLEAGFKKGFESMGKFLDDLFD